MLEIGEVPIGRPCPATPRHDAWELFPLSHGFIGLPYMGLARHLGRHIILAIGDVLRHVCCHPLRCVVPAAHPKEGCR
jgi:hypothetical protein